MTADVSKNEILFLSGLIRKNHFNLYEKLTKICSLKTVINDNYSSVISDAMEWPNMIYNLNCKAETTVLLKELKNKIDEKKLPEFIIVDSLAKPKDFDIQVRNFGILPVMRWPGMIFLPGQKPHNRKLPKKFTIQRVTDMDTLNDWISIANTNLFPKKGLKSNEFKTILIQESIHAFLGYFNDIPVSTVLINYHLDTSGIYIASTLPEYSGKGFMSSLINFSISQSRSEGYKYTLLEATSKSYHLYSSLGFKEVCKFDIYWKSQ